LYRREVNAKDVGAGVVVAGYGDGRMVSGGSKGFQVILPGAFGDCHRMSLPSTAHTPEPVPRSMIF